MLIHIPSNIKDKDLIYDYVTRLCKELRIHRLRNREIIVRFKSKMAEDAWGYCHGNTHDIEIEINRTISFDDQMQTLAHEMVHAKQFLRKEFDGNNWKNRNYDHREYIDQPWEKEANRLEAKLYSKCF